jgi:protein-disulfide isomerase
VAFNTAIENIQNQTPPPGTAAIQMNLLSPLTLAQSAIEADIAAVDLLLLASGQTELETEEIIFNELTAAKVVIEQEGQFQEVYAIPLVGGSYALVSVFGFDDTALAATADDVAAILESLSINYAGELPEAIFDYASLPQSRTSEGFPVIGNPESGAKLAEISSFSCPHCGDYHKEALPAILDLVAANDASFTYVPYFGAGNIGDGQLAAVAAMCADQQDAFWLYHDALFSWQKFGTFAFVRERLIDGATNLELDVDAFTICLDQTETENTLNAAVNYAQTIQGFQGTPTLVLNNVQISSGPIEAIELAITNALESGAEATPEATAGS